MTNNKNRGNDTAFLIPVIREKLRTRSLERSERLNRSVGRQTSSDLLPCPEYRDVVAQEARWMDELSFTQHCRAALERAIDSGYARLVYTEAGGKRRVVEFTMTRNHRIKVRGLTL